MLHVDAVTMRKGVSDVCKLGDGDTYRARDKKRLMEFPLTLKRETLLYLGLCPETHS